MQDLPQDAINAQIFERLTVLQKSTEETQRSVKQLLANMHKNTQSEKSLMELKERLDTHEKEFSSWRERVNTAFLVGSFLCTMFAIVVSVVAFIFS